MKHYQQSNHCLALGFRYYVLAIIFFKLGLLQLFHLTFSAMHYDVVLLNAYVVFSLANRDLSVWCHSCNAYLNAQLIPELRPVYETAHILKFGEAPSFWIV
jgi:hypothetical protein